MAGKVAKAELVIRLAVQHSDLRPGGGRCGVEHVAHKVWATRGENVHVRVARRCGRTQELHVHGLNHLLDKGVPSLRTKGKLAQLWKLSAAVNVQPWPPPVLAMSLANLNGDVLLVRKHCHVVQERGQPLLMLHVHVKVKSSVVIHCKHAKQVIPVRKTKKKKKKEEEEEEEEDEEEEGETEKEEEEEEDKKKRREGRKKKEEKANKVNSFEPCPVFVRDGLLFQHVSRTAAHEKAHEGVPT